MAICACTLIFSYCIVCSSPTASGACTGTPPLMGSSLNLGLAQLLMGPLSFAIWVGIGGTDAIEDELIMY
ncbi:hypothetical protein TorRG33x02_301310 [Trema orientale]|uniref:Uncharacterized protein n=1 Tax=Trema orientale TaxID=63057 RepID=A0A2P5C182_TREOI|nr:hypothetical protein TorRG33x02_301310 [Trema orientale]